MNRRRWLVPHGVDGQAWAKRWQIEPFVGVCSACGAVATTTVPFAVGTLRGLAAPACACGNERTPYAVVRDPRAGDLFSGDLLG